MNPTRSKTPVLSLLLLCVILAASSVSAYADTQYVSDVLIITMRSKPGEEYRIVKTLKTDTAVEVLDTKGDYFKVRTEDGKKGWVRQQYITPDIPKVIVISRLEAEITRLKGRVKRLAGERDSLTKGLKTEKGLRGSAVSRLEKTLREKSGQVTSLTAQLREMTGKYKRLLADSGDVIKLVKERDTLKKDNARLFLENSDLVKNNDRLRQRSGVYWFLAGGGVLLGGWIIGRLSRRKKSEFY